MSAVEDLTKELLAANGEFLQGKALWNSLGYRSRRSLYRAIAGQTRPPPVPVFKIEGRRGWAARTRDVADWLANVQRRNGDQAGDHPIK